MMRLIRAAYVIARRDYVATVWSRTFLLFLVGPLLPAVFGGLYGAIVAGQDQPRARAVQIIMAREDADAVIAARAALARRLGETTLPPISRTADADDQAILTGSIDRPTLVASSNGLRRLSGKISLILDQARAARDLGSALPAPVKLATRASDAGRAAGDAARRMDDSRTDVARGGQFVLFFLTMLLAGMMISNLVEEKSSKVIETLAAAVPIDAIFLGKLAGMLCVSLTGIAVWTTAGVIGSGFLPSHFSVPAPAVGWPAFVGLGVVYFATVYLLIGALYLGIGAQAGSVREVQTLSMPLTMGQLVIFALASAAVAEPDRPIALLADVIPWTSPFSMMARAALRPDIWPHFLALAWQVAALAVMVRVGAALFRRNVLKSGRGGVKP